MLRPDPFYYYNPPGEPEDWDDFGWLELTAQGQKVLDQLENI